MTSTFRATKEIEDLLRTAAKLTGQPRSEIIRQAIAEYCTRLLQQQSQTWGDALNASGYTPIRSGIKDLATNREHLKKAIRNNAKRSSR